MGDSGVEEDGNDLSDRDAILAKHKREKKDVQAKIQALKKTATKGDKKKKREVQEEIVKLESDMDKRHSEELARFDVDDDAEPVSAELLEGQNDRHPSSGQQQRLSKAQRRRDKREMQMKQRELDIVEQESEGLSEARTVELKTIQEILKKRGLELYEIPSDGNCLYFAVDHQLKETRGHGPGVTVLRQRTGDILSANPSEYLPFLSHPDTGEIFTMSQYEDYCQQVVNTPAWGGQVELRALSQALNCCIEVIQAEGPSSVVGENYGEPRLVLTFHRRMYSLGEHYNSVVKRDVEACD